MAITFRQLQHFLALSEELHFGRAAAKLNISQPPLSASLRQLEDHLGCPLMERSSKQVRLTEAGAVFAAQAARILGQLDHAQALASRAAASWATASASGSSAAVVFAFGPKKALPTLSSQRFWKT